ncbi:unnamed protein product [Ilex paraguariensis]|uniref:Uncharacterized protein n=1 Tax=Ilex paraguariensis TaxID=185542 RepID=A0ABC8TYQ0_9AQUA
MDFESTSHTTRPTPRRSLGSRLLPKLGHSSWCFSADQENQRSSQDLGKSQKVNLTIQGHL